MLTMDHALANVTLVDLDALDAEKMLGDFRHAYPVKPVIALSILQRSMTVGHCEFVRKPINHLQLRQQLESVKTASEQSIKIASETMVSASPVATEARQYVHAKTSHAARYLAEEEVQHFVGQQADIDLQDTNALAHVIYSPALMFQGAILKGLALAQRSQSPVEVIAFGMGVVLDPVAHKAYSAVTDSILRPICLLETHDEPKYQKVGPNFLSEPLYTFQMKKSVAIKPTDLDAFLWRVTLWSSRGRIPKGTDIHQAVELKAWPNLTRLDAIPNAPRIAALMMRGPQTLGEIAKKLDIPQRYVFAFYSASTAIGLANTVAKPVETVVADIKPAAPPRSILGKLLGRLMRKSPATTLQHQAV